MANVGNSTGAMPSALGQASRFVAASRDAGLVVALDYDGTLTPITARPADACLDEATRDVLRRLAARWPLWIVSGRDLADVSARVALPEVGCAGCHGFDIAGPGVRFEHPEGIRAAPELAALHAELAAALAGVDGVRFETKRFTLAVHYRQAAAEARPTVIAATSRAAAAHPSLGVQSGKCVVEVLPTPEWNKGAALRWIAARFGAPLVIYAGDDATDEHAFAAVRDHGAGILVGAEPRPTAASYALRDPAEVRAFLKALLAT